MTDSTSQNIKDLQDFFDDYPDLPPPTQSASANLQMFPKVTTRKNESTGKNGRPIITFGVELEMTIAWIYPNDTDPEPEDPRIVKGIVVENVDSSLIRVQVYKHIMNTLRKAGIRCLSDWGFEAVLGEKETYWLIKDDGSIYPPTRPYDQRDDYQFIGVEITSPPFYSCEDARAQAAVVYDILTSNYRVSCPESTGMHVHVGLGLRNGVEKAWNTRVLANLMAVLWVFEDRLDLIHPQRRRTGGYSNLEAAVLGESLKESPNWKREGLESILELKDEKDCMEIRKLLSFKGGINRVNYNIRNLADNVKRGRTIEYRQNEGTLHGKRVSAWVKVCAGLVEFALTVDQDKLEDFLRRCVDDAPEDYTVIDLLIAIGSSDVAEFYAYRFRDNDPTQTPPTPSPLDTPPRDASPPGEVYTFYILGM
ncbi:hypothetical protein HYALB_00001764 [Hymenoscyphus albidus]|uniref:Uncharacterized protein n=1 Tax=Hymenoscyphus albidus TaxID=595503 RepID=A0A9N9LSS2_9HELO|nr:hypothetical protein HYALB_00001764 [Hymenoscyphus albidus]